MTLKELRKQRGLTQKQAAETIRMSLRSYISYEHDESKIGTPKYVFLVKLLDQFTQIDEEHGILSIDQITETCREVFEDYDIKYCYLFGSYCKGSATEKSDVDLLISTPLTGLKFFGLAEALREKLNKKVDLLNTKQLANNELLLEEILDQGIKIYGKN